MFENNAELPARVDVPALEVGADCVLVLQNAGPLGGPGMPEWDQLPIPKQPLAQCVRDMLRISDCRMSGTSYGACVLHVAPESFVGGPLALVGSGDRIELDIPARHLHVSDEELTARRAAWTAPPQPYARGLGALYGQHVRHADSGCDFASLSRTETTAEPDIYWMSVPAASNPSGILTVDPGAGAASDASP